MAEQNSPQDKTPRIKQRTHSIEEQESRQAYAGTARQRRRQSAQARNKFRHHQASHPVAREHIPRAPHARVRLERDAAEQIQHALATMASQIKPGNVGHNRSQRGAPSAPPASSFCRPPPTRRPRATTALQAAGRPFARRIPPRTKPRCRVEPEIQCFRSLNHRCRPLRMLA